MEERIPQVGDILLADIPGLYGPMYWSDTDDRYQTYPAGEHYYVVTSDNDLFLNYIRFYLKGRSNKTHLIKSDELVWLEEEQIWVTKPNYRDEVT